MKKNEEILKNILEKIDKNVLKPFVTAQFGDHWKEHTKKQFLIGEMDIDDIINIAWKQGRKTILLEKTLNQLIESKNL